MRGVFLESWDHETNNYMDLMVIGKSLTKINIRFSDENPLKNYDHLGDRKQRDNYLYGIWVYYDGVISNTV